jgi:DNA-binding HxlR family transcriptional regulator
MQVQSVTMRAVLGKTYDSQVCSIARALEVVGERWSLLIIRDALFAGSTRYSDFQRSLGIATNILKDRLDGFVHAGMMRRHRYSEQPELYEYVLTHKGRDLAPALIALSDWGDRWAAPDGPPMLYNHTVCGSAVGPQVVCTTCGPLDDPAEVQARPGPGMPAERVQFLDTLMGRRSGAKRVAAP